MDHVKGQRLSLVSSGPRVSLHHYQDLALRTKDLPLHKGHPTPTQKTPSCNLTTKFPCSLGVFFLSWRDWTVTGPGDTRPGSQEIRFQIHCSFHVLVIMVTISRAPALGQAPCPALSVHNHSSPAKGSSFTCPPLSPLWITVKLSRRSLWFHGSACL